MDQQVTITIPGWVWLLMIAFLGVVITWRMVKTIGLADLFFINKEPDVNEFARLMVFSIVVGVIGVCVWVTVEPLLT